VAWNVHDPLHFLASTDKGMVLWFDARNTGPSAARSLSAKPPCTCPTVARILCCRTRSTLARAQVREPT
jgi:hypothetical protein